MESLTADEARRRDILLAQIDAIWAEYDVEMQKAYHARDVEDHDEASRICRAAWDRAQLLLGALATTAGQAPVLG